MFRSMHEEVDLLAIAPQEALWPYGTTARVAQSSDREFLGTRSGSRSKSTWIDDVFSRNCRYSSWTTKRTIVLCEFSGTRSKSTWMPGVCVCVEHMDRR